MAATRRHAAILSSLICVLVVVTSVTAVATVATGNFHDGRADKYTTEDTRDQRTQLEGTPLSLPIVKTYEQVVLEGSKVYLVCPHARLHHTIVHHHHHQGSSSPIPLQDPLTGESAYGVGDSKDIKQQTLPTINSLGQNDDAAAVIKHIFTLNDEEPVKWFKNHVPMRRELSSSSSAAAVAAAAAAANLPRQRGSEIGAAQNNGLMVGASGGGTVELESGDAENTDASISEDLRAVSLVRGNEFSSTNQQRQQQQQQLNNRADWHINELGELVLERVTKYFSGKYTCLNDGQQSELLLDVVPTDVSNRSRPFITPTTTTNITAAATTSDAENDSNLDVTTSADGNDDDDDDEQGAENAGEGVREGRATTSAQMMSAIAAHTNGGRARDENGRRARNVLKFQPPSSSFNSKAALFAPTKRGADVEVPSPLTRHDTLPAVAVVVVDELPPLPSPPSPPLYWAPGSGQIDRASRVDVANANVTLTPKTIVAGQLLNDANNGHGTGDKDFRLDTDNIFRGPGSSSSSYDGALDSGLELQNRRGGETQARVSSDQVTVFTPVQQQTDFAVDLPKSSKGKHIESNRGQQEQQSQAHMERQWLFTNPDDKDLSSSPQRRRRTISSQPEPPQAKEDMSEARDWYSNVHTDRKNISSAANSAEQQTNLQQLNQTKGGDTNYTRSDEASDKFVAVGKHYDSDNLDDDDDIAEVHKIKNNKLDDEEEENDNDVDEEIESILSRHVKRRSPIHFIDSDIISPNDLDSVPGLMYTKQRLYCPALNQLDIRLALREQIFILVRKFCPHVKQQQQQQQQHRRRFMNISSSSLNATPAGKIALHKCENLANHLIRQLLHIGGKCNSSQIVAATAASSSSSNQPFRPAISGVNEDPLQPAAILTQCSHEFANFLDLIWYKDGTRLEFDSLTGRGLNKKLNLKLIDFIDQFEMTEKGTTSSNDDNGTRSSSSSSSSSSSGIGIGIGGSSSDGVTSRRVSVQSEATHVVGRKRRAPLNWVGGGDTSQASSWPSSLYQRQQQQQASKKRKRQQQRRQRLRQRRWRRGQPDGEHYEQVAAAAAASTWRGRTRRHRGPAALLRPSPVCPPRGLILEIDGIHRANAGRYTCALRFNIAKLLTFLRTLRQLNVPSSSSSSNGGPINWKRSGRLLDCCCCSKNDKSKQRCDHLVEAEGAYRSGDGLRQALKGSKEGAEAQMELDNAPEMGLAAGKIRSAVAAAAATSKTNDNNIEQRERRGNGNDGVGLPHSQGRVSSALNLSGREIEKNTTPEPSDSLANSGNNDNNIRSATTITTGEREQQDEEEQSSLAKQINTLSSILNETISSKEAVDHIGRSLAGPQPLTIIQTFVLIVNERPANSCQLWSTILDANEAHSRRKLADFKRLKRSLTASRHEQQQQQRRRPAQQWNSASNGQQISPLASLGSSSSSSFNDWRQGNERKGDKLATPASLSWSNGASNEPSPPPPSPSPLTRSNGGIETYAVNDMRRAAAAAVDKDDVATLSEAIEGHIVNYNDYAQSAALEHDSGRVQQFDDKANASSNDLNDHHHYDSDEGAGGGDRLSTTTHKRRRPRRSITTTQDAISVFSGGHHSNDDQQTVGLKGGSARVASQSDASNHNHNQKEEEEEVKANKRLERPQAISGTGLLNKPGHLLSGAPPSPSAIEKQWAAREMPFNYANERNLKRHHSTLAWEEAAAAAANNKNNSTGATKITPAANGGGGADATMMMMMMIKDQQQQLSGSKDGSYKIRQTGETLALPRAVDGYHRDEDDEHHYSASGSSGPVVVFVGGAVDDAGNKTKDFSTQSQRINTRRQTELTLRHADDDDDSANQSARSSHSIDMKTADGSSSTAWRQSNALGSRAPIPQDAPGTTTTTTTTTTTMSQLSRGASNVKIDDRHGGGFKGASAQSNILAKLGQVMRSAYIIDGNNLAKSTRTTTTTTTASAKLTATAASREFDAMVIGHVQAKSNTREGGRQFDRRLGETDRGVGVGGGGGAGDDSTEGTVHHTRHRRSALVASLPNDSGQINLADRRQAGKSGLEFVTEKSNIQRADGRANIDEVTYQRRSQQRQERASATYEEEDKLEAEQKSRNENYNESTGNERGQINDHHHHQAAPPIGPQREHQSDGGGLKSGDKLHTSSQHKLEPDERLNLGSGKLQEDTTSHGKLSSSIETKEGAADELIGSTLTLASNYNRLIDENVEASAGEPTMNGVIGNDDDESLLWTASQYLYMHMRALASSSIYGVQVDVEWSNENEHTNNRTASTIEARQNIPVVPFATIDLVAGQNLHLQCTAQALGRLPEVKWYKRIGRKIPEYIPAQVVGKLARSIGGDTYWPVAELDLLNDDLHNLKNFVCSQSISIFDNLLNQTFTVVNNLKLSQFNDKIELPPTLTKTTTTTTTTTDDDEDDNDGANALPMINPSNTDGDSGLYNLYACFVDADIRHDYATLGVYFRQANAKLPIGLTKRLKARSMFDVVSDTTANNIITTSKSAIVNVDPTQVSDFGQVSISEYNMLRQSHLMFPYKRMWVPLRQNGSYLGGGRSNDDEAEETLFLLNNYNSSFPMSPLVLSVVIALVFGSLLGLVYLTLRSYQALTSNQQHLDEEHDEDGNNLRCTLLSPTDNNWTHTSESYCHFNLSDRSIEHTLDADVQLDDVGLMQDYQIINSLPPSPAILRAPTVLLDRTNQASTSSLYRAHIHNLDDVQCDYSENRALTMNLIVSDDDQDYELEASTLCTTSNDQLVNITQSSNVRNMINIMSNPLNSSNNNNDDDNN